MKEPFFKIFSISLFFFFLKNYLNAQIPPFKITHIGTENGLSQGSVYSIFKDSRGIIWFGTQDGLNAYDGRKIKIFKQSNLKGTLHGNRIGGIIEDNDGDLWIGTESGLNKYNYFTDDFICYFKNQEVFPLLANKNYIWIHASKSGYIKIDKTTGKWTTFYEKGLFDSNYTSTKNSSIIISDNEFCLQTNDGIIYYKNGISKFYFSKSKQNIAGESLTITKIKKYGTKIYVSTNEGIQILNPISNEITQLPKSTIDTKVLIFDFDISNDGKIWMATDQKGLLIFDLIKNKIIEFRKNENSKFDLTDSNISTVYIDLDNVIWLNTDPFGIDKIQFVKNNFGYLTIPFPKTIPDNIINQSIRGIVETKSDELWLGTLNTGLWVLDKNTKTIKKSFVNIGNDNPLPSNHIKFLHKSNNGTIWIGTESGLARYTSGRLIKMKMPNYKNSSTGTFIRSIEEYKGKIYICTEEGIAVYDKNNYEFEKYRLLPNEKMTFSLHLSDNKWFAGTFDNGLFFIENGKVKKIIKDILPTFIKQNKEGKFYLGSDKGLFTIDSTAKIISSFDVKKGLQNDFLYCGEIDEKGFLWVSTNKGILKIDPKKQTSFGFNLNDGLQDFEFNGFSSFKSDKNVLYFGGIKGLNYFSSSQIDIPQKQTKNILLEDSKSLTSIEIQYFIDKNTQFKIPNLENRNFMQSFFKLTNQIPNFSYTDKAVWLRFFLKNNSSHKWYMEIENSRLNKIEVWIYEKGNLMSKKIGGDILPDEKSDFTDIHPIFALDLIENQEYEIFVRAETNRDLKLPISFWEESYIAEHISNRKLIWGIYTGFVLLISLYNLFLWISIKDITYLYYMCYVLFFGTFQLSIYGLFKQYIWDNNRFNEYGFIISLFLSNIFLALFSERFLNLKTYLKHWFKIKYIIIIGLSIAALLTPIFYSSNFNYVAIGVGIFYNLLYAYFCYAYLKQNQKIIYYYGLAISFLAIASAIVALQNLALIQADYQEYIIMIGSMLEIVLFSLALGFKFREIELEKARQLQLRIEISSNLHDDLAASLSSLTMYSELSKKKVKNNDSEIMQRLDAIANKSRDILNKVRTAVYEINPKNDSEVEWLERIISFGLDIFESKSINFSSEISPKFNSNSIKEKYRRQIFLIFKEAIHNVAKYSDAKNVTLKIQTEKESTIITLIDDGVGINQELINNGNGMENMKTRAQKINGQLNVFSKPNMGTEIQVIV